MPKLNEFLNMDCMIGMSNTPDKYFDLAIVDPQYGIHAPQMNMGTNKNRQRNGYPSVSTADTLRASGLNADWDAQPPPAEYFAELFRVSKNQVIWGGNYFDLPPSRCIICWDKLQPWDNFSQWEMAWTSFDRPAKMYRISNTGGGNHEQKICYTQKPVELYLRTLRDFAKCGYKILDTHVGSASSLIACYKMGFDYMGFEKDPFMYGRADERLKSVKSQQSLFIQ
jgi:site-specific DNA-methyltransferase (adenine-specific)